MHTLYPESSRQAKETEAKALDSVYAEKKQGPLQQHPITVTNLNFYAR